MRLRPIFHVFSATALAAGLALGACGEPEVGGSPDAGSPDAGTGGTPDAGTTDTEPSITITRPTAATTWDLPADAEESFPVSFEVKNFALKPKGTCADATACGRVRVRIDGDACNWDGLAFNAIAVASPAYAAFRPCPDPVGKKTIALELVDDAGQPVKDASGKDVRATVEVTMQENLTDPAVGITDPTGENVVDIAGSGSAPVTVALERFTLKDPGTCAGAEHCGHLHLFIDGDECNGGGDYNNAGVSPLDALFSKCASPVGEHTILVELHDDAHGEVHDQYDNVVSDYVVVQTREER